MDSPSSEQGKRISTGQLLRMPVEWRIDQIIDHIDKSGSGVISVVYLDIDGFGQVEKEHGYGLADALLETIAQRAASIKEADFSARYVRDSFLIVYNDLTLEETFLSAEQLRRELSQEVFTIIADRQTARIEVTFSAGVSTYPGDPKDRYELISMAEEAARRAHEHGGARTMLGRATQMTTKTTHYSHAQLERLRELREKLGRPEAALLREALDDLLRKYDQRDVRRGVVGWLYDKMVSPRD